ncbi:MAG: hypothetical protein ABI847_02645 [Anaerolineales bacterium]
MNDNKLNSMAAEDVLARVTDGTAVYDSTGEHIGKVDAIYLGAKADGDTAEGGPATTGAVPAEAVDADVKIFAGLFFTKSDIPEEVRERLRYNGFIRIAPHGLFRSHRYATREQVVAASSERVTLSSPESKLLKG